MCMEIKYTLTPGNGRPIKVGPAKDVIEYLLTIDDTLSGMCLANKHRVFWKDGLSDKAAKI